MLRKMHKPTGSGTQAGQGSTGRDPAGAGNRSWPRVGRSALKIAAAYAICGFFWIALSDRILAELIQNSTMLTRFQTYKGWGFILITAALVFALSRRALRETERLSLSVGESEAKLNTILDNVGAAIFIKDAQYRYTYVNRKTAEILGLRIEEILGKGDEAFFSRESVVEIMQSDRMVIEKGETVAREEVNLVASHGMPRTYWTVKLPLRNAGGDVTGLCGISTDITERERAEVALRASEEALRNAQEIARIGSWRYEVREDRIWWSDELYRIFDIAPPGREISLPLVLDRVHPDDRNTFLAQVSSRESHRTDYRVLMPDGAVKFVHEEVRVERDQQGVPVRMYGTAQDITERKVAEDAFRRSKEIMEKTFQGLDSALFILDSSSPPVITDCNPAATSMFGYPRSEMLGRTTAFLHLSGESLAAFHKRTIAAIEKQGLLSSFEFQMKRQNGEIFPSEHSVLPLKDDRGNRTGWVSVVKDITERKRIEQAVREREEKFKALVETSYDWIWEVNEEGVYTYASPRVENILGYTTEEVVGRTPFDFMPPDERARVAERFRAVIADRKPLVGLENTNLHKNGKRVILETSGMPILDAAGSFRGYRGIDRDITERKRAEEALQRSERMLQTIIDAEPECVKLLDQDACVIMMNRAGLEMIQVDSFEQVKGQCVCPMVGTGDREAFMDLTRRVFQGESGTLSFEMVGVKGRRLWLETRAVPLRNEKEEIVALLGVTRDITARKLADEALRASEARFRSIIEHASSGVLVADIETRGFVYANPEICRMLGYHRDELLRLTVQDLHPAEDLPLVQETFAARTGMQTRCRRKDGTVFPVEIRSVELELDGRACLVGFFTDLTEKRLLEEERVKTEKLESIGTLAGGIAHDFNNLLQGVFGYISIAKMTVDRREEALAMLGRAEKALHQTVNLTSQLLTFSKGGKPVKKLIDLRRVIETAAAFSLSGSRTEYQLAAGDDLWSVEADEGQITQVVQNIVLNADQAMPEGGTVRIAAWNVPEGDPGAPQGLVRGDYVGLSISDSGIGIPAEYLKKIFDPYFTTKEKGSGLGLATSYSIVRNHGGMIAVRSAPGSGTTFTLYLPAAAERAAREQDRPVRAPERSGRLLVMDDEEVVRTVARELIQALGHDVEVAAHGEEAVRRYEEARTAGRPFDVVILDLTIRGGMGGLETMKKLLAVDPGVKAVVSSGYSDEAVISRYREQGFRAFLKKPYDIAELQNILIDLIR